MKLNNKGFAISSVMYSLLILAVSLMFGILAILVSRKMTLDKIKDNVKKTVNGDILVVPEEYKGITPKVYAVGDPVYYANLNWTVVKDNGNTVTVVLNDKISSTGSTYASYQTDLNNFINNNPVLSIAKKNNYIVSMSFAGTNNYVRTLMLSDIFGNGVTSYPTGITNGIIKNCKFCGANYNYYLIDQSGSSSYRVDYDATNVVNYINTGTGNGNIRPVITIKEKN